jgi:thiamine pyrophosphate-dependent acetolactate synthase large subunit-like protein
MKIRIKKAQWVYEHSLNINMNDSVGKTVGVDVAIIGQVNDALNALIQALKDKIANHTTAT